MGQGQESGILDKIPAVDFRDPLREAGRSLERDLGLFCFHGSFSLLEIRLHGLQVFTVLVTQIPLTGALHDRPIGKDLMPLLRVSFGLHLEQMRSIPLSYLHTSPPRTPWLSCPVQRICRVARLSAWPHSAPAS